MKVFLGLALLVVAASALPVEEDPSKVNGENGWYVPQQDGSFAWMSKEEGEQLLAEQRFLEGRAVTITPVNYYLYTKKNPTKPQEITATAQSISGSNFNAKNPTRFVIHGWTQSYEDPMNSEIRDAWFTHGDFNMIIVDWGRARSVDYASSVIAVPKVGEKVGSMIDYLHKSHGMPVTNLIIIGHSLGAHVAGYAGKTMSGKAQAIFGLDPALPLFNYDNPNTRLSTTDAAYVESIQTCGGLLGFLKPIGKGAFYPNGGKTQPGCGLDATGSCAHSRSVTYYVEATRKNDFPSMKCANYENAVAKTCGSTYSSVRMGSASNSNMAAGDFYVPVNSKAPFGKGA